MKIESIFKWLAITLGSLIALIIIVIIGAIVISNWHASQNKKFLETAYQKISIPTSMTLTNSYWIGGNIDTADYWHYTYSGIIGQSIQEFKTAVAKAGYTIQQSRPATTYVATNTAADTRLRFFPGDQQNAATISVEVFRASIGRDAP